MKRKMTYSIAAISMLILILDAKTAVYGCSSGVEMCLKTVIPALFPFIFLSGILSTGQAGTKPATKIFLLGLIGGYPVGAKNVYEAYKSGQIDRISARRMLGFCNNAGPSFIFGFLSGYFHSPVIPWVIWFVQIISALLVATVLPGKVTDIRASHVAQTPPLPKLLQNAVLTMGNICGWVILFKAVFSYLDKWLFQTLSATGRVLLFGAMEITNGCFFLYQLPSEATIFIFACTILAFGGLCVAMQTGSVTKELGFGMYFPGKLLQCLFTFILSALLAAVLW